mmetsp:Transcript_3577/g.7913  ORF Transcript_3577/g.7913 Transcript_3577/m.7913 type:complete len:241 (+) Transcript_3577:130-852(+)
MVAYSKIVIAGGGVIGNSISYYLAKRHGASCTIIDPVGIAPAASGKAGGFLAKDWSEGSPIGELMSRSFDLHAEQADDLGAEKIDYRRLEAAAVMMASNGSGRKPAGKKLEGVEWADVNVVGGNILGREDTIAQVHPKKLCEAMWNYSKESVGSKLILGKIAEAITDSDNKRIIGVRLEDGSTVDADALIVACGPWTDGARSWFGSEVEDKMPRMYGIKVTFYSCYFSTMVYFTLNCCYS